MPNHKHFLIHKPYGYLSQFIYELKRKKKLLGELYNFPEGTMAIGRLDEDSEGLLLLTSDGQLQKVLIARALAQDTPLIILDEPTTHLDLLHKVSVFKLLKKLSQETNKCILFSTHDIDLAIQLSDEMIVMTENNVVQDQPCNLISKGVFNSLFKDENIVFDGEKGKFVVS